MEYLVIFIIFAAILKGVFAPNTNSTSYRLGRGLGNKTRKFGDWLMKDD